MRPKRRVTLVLMFAGLAAIGCSERVETAEKVKSSASGTAKPIATSEPSGTKLIETDRSGGPSPLTATPSFADGEAAYRARKFSDAAAIFEHHVNERPEHALGHYMLGLSAWKGNDLAKAEKAFDAAFAIDPTHVKSLVNLSRVLIDQKRFDEAAVRLTRASEVDPGSNEVQRLLGRAYYSRGEADASEGAYRRAIELDARDVWSMNNLGLLLLELQRADEALPLLTKAVELRKDVPAFHNNLGMALEHTGRLEEAAAEYVEALRADPNYDRAKQNLARLEAVLGHC